jgi:PAS domain S-box-containing protein
MKEMIIGLMQNIAILFAFAMLYENFWLKIEISKTYTYQFITGLILGIIGIALIFTPWIMIPGLVFDTRSIMLSVAGLFFGPIPTITAIFITGVMRLVIGGEGVWMGLAVIVSSGTIGLLWRAYRLSWKQKNTYLELFSLGLIVHFVMLMCTVLLPAKEIFPTIRAIAIPLILIYTPGTMLLGIVLFRQSNNFQNFLANEKLRESERRLGKILKSGNIASVILDNFGRVVFCNKYLLNITGYSEEEVINKYWFDLFIPLYLRDDIKSIFAKALKGTIDTDQNENEIIAKNGDKIYISWHFTNLLDEKNEVTGMACIGVNITDRINYELSLNAKNKKYLEINEKLSLSNAKLKKSID